MPRAPRQSAAIPAVVAAIALFVSSSTAHAQVNVGAAVGGIGGVALGGISGPMGAGSLPGTGVVPGTGLDHRSLTGLPGAVDTGVPISVRQEARPSALAATAAGPSCESLLMPAQPKVGSHEPKVDPQAVRIRRQGAVYQVQVGRTGQTLEAWSLADVVRIIAAQTEARPAKSGSLRLELPGFTREEAHGLLRSAGLGDVFGVLSRSSSERLSRALHARYDLSAATVHALEYKERSDGTAELGVSVEIPVTGEPSLWVKVKILFKHAVPVEVRERVHAAVIRVVDALRGRPVSAQRLGVGIRREMKGVLRRVGDTTVTIDLRSESVDLRIMRLDPLGAPNGRALG